MKIIFSILFLAMLMEYGHLFADFTVPDAEGKEQVFKAGVSGLSQEQRENIFYSLGTENLWEGGIS